MKTKFILSLLILIGLMFSCSTEKQPKETDSKSKNLGQKETTVKGVGDKVNKIWLNSGLAIFSIKNSGSHNFIVWLKDSNGQELELLANDIGSYTGEKSVHIIEDGSYILQVESSGIWLITIK